MAESTRAHTEVPSGGHGQFPPFRRDTVASQLFWFAITFIALYVMVAKIALPRIGGILEAECNALFEYPPRQYSTGPA